MAVFETKLLRLSVEVTISIKTSSPQSGPIRPKAPTLVFLHFWGGSHKTWAKVIDPLCLTYPTVAIDFRGWGDSSGPERADAYSVSDLAGDVAKVVEEQNLNNFVLVGLSMGAKVAQLMAGTHEMRKPRGLVLVSPAPPTPLVLPADMRKQQLHAYDSVESAGFVARNVLTASDISTETVEFLVEDMMRGNKWAAQAWPSYAMEEDVSARARDITVPVLVIAGGKDVVEPRERIEKEVCGSIPGAELHEIAFSGHLSPVEAPAEVSRLIGEFLQRL